MLMGEEFRTWLLSKRMIVDAQGEQEKGVRDGASLQVRWSEEAHIHTQKHICGNRRGCADDRD